MTFKMLYNFDIENYLENLNLEEVEIYNESRNKLKIVFYNKNKKGFNLVPIKDFFKLYFEYNEDFKDFLLEEYEGETLKEKLSDFILDFKTTKKVYNYIRYSLDLTAKEPYMKIKDDKLHLTYNNCKFKFNQNNNIKENFEINKLKKYIEIFKEAFPNFEKLLDSIIYNLFNENKIPIFINTKDTIDFQYFEELFKSLYETYINKQKFYYPYKNKEKKEKLFLLISDIKYFKEKELEQLLDYYKDQNTYINSKNLIIVGDNQKDIDIFNKIDNINNTFYFDLTENLEFEDIRRKYDIKIYEEFKDYIVYYMENYINDKIEFIKKYNINIDNIKDNGNFKYNLYGLGNNTNENYKESLEFLDNNKIHYKEFLFKGIDKDKLKENYIQKLEKFFINFIDKKEVNFFQFIELFHILSITDKTTLNEDFLSNVSYFILELKKSLESYLSYIENIIINTKNKDIKEEYIKQYILINKIINLIIDKVDIITEKPKNLKIEDLNKFKNDNTDFNDFSEYKEIYEEQYYDIYNKEIFNFKNMFNNKEISFIYLQELYDIEFKKEHNIKLKNLEIINLKDLKFYITNFSNISFKEEINFLIDNLIKIEKDFNNVSFAKFSPYILKFFYKLNSEKNINKEQEFNSLLKNIFIKINSYTKKEKRYYDSKNINLKNILNLMQNFEEISKNFQKYILSINIQQNILENTKTYNNYIDKYYINNKLSKFLKNINNIIENGKINLNSLEIIFINLRKILFYINNNSYLFNKNLKLLPKEEQTKIKKEVIELFNKELKILYSKLKPKIIEFLNNKNNLSEEDIKTLNNFFDFKEPEIEIIKDLKKVLNSKEIKEKNFLNYSELVLNKIFNKYLPKNLKIDPNLKDIIKDIVYNLKNIYKQDSKLFEEISLLLMVLKEEPNKLKKFYNEIKNIPEEDKYLKLLENLSNEYEINNKLNGKSGNIDKILYFKDKNLLKGIDVTYDKSSTVDNMHNNDRMYQTIRHFILLIDKKEELEQETNQKINIEYNFLANFSFLSNANNIYKFNNKFIKSFIQADHLNHDDLTFYYLLYKLPEKNYSSFEELINDFIDYYYTKDIYNKNDKTNLKKFKRIIDSYDIMENLKQNFNNINEILYNNKLFKLFNKNNQFKNIIDDKPNFKQEIIIEQELQQEIFKYQDNFYAFIRTNNLNLLPFEIFSEFNDSNLITNEVIENFNNNIKIYILNLINNNFEIENKDKIIKNFKNNNIQNNINILLEIMKQQIKYANTEYEIFSNKSIKKNIIKRLSEKIKDINLFKSLIENLENKIKNKQEKKLNQNLLNYRENLYNIFEENNITLIKTNKEKFIKKEKEFYKTSLNKMLNFNLLNKIFIKELNKNIKDKNIKTLILKDINILYKKYPENKNLIILKLLEITNSFKNIENLSLLNFGKINNLNIISKLNFNIINLDKYKIEENQEILEELL